jgi:arylsulfatase A-like enzyme
MMNTGKRMVRRLLSFCGLLTIALFCGCGFGDQGAPKPPEGGTDKKDAINVLLITIDTCRADHLGCYGNKEIKTPAIDEIASRGVLFENAYSPAPITLPTHSSILTGQHPIQHGVRTNGLFALGEDSTSLAEILKEQGYETAAFVSAYVLDSIFGLDQGFDLYEDDLSSGRQNTMFQIKERGAELVTDLIDDQAEDDDAESERPKPDTEDGPDLRPGEIELGLHLRDYDRSETEEKGRRHEGGETCPE